MSQAWASLSRKLTILSICFLFSACNGSYTAFESDADFDVDAKTVDIEQDNAEEITLAAVQSAYLAHYRSALYHFLDASDLPDYDSVLPESAALIPGVDTYEKICLFGGTVKYSFTRENGEIHKIGDRIALSFNACKEDGVIYDGLMTGRYTKVKGLNNTFVGNDTNTCLAKLQDELNLSNSQVIFVAGDDVKFRNVADTVEVDVIDYIFMQDQEEGLERIDVVLETKVVGKTEKAIIVNNILSPPENALTSIDGDQIYSVQDMVQEKHDCQKYERTLSVSLTNFSTEIDDLKTTLDGSVTLFEAQDTPNRYNQEILDSNFQTKVKQGNVTNIFKMTGYRVQKAVQVNNDSYSYLFEGLVSSPALSGTVQLTSTSKLFGNFDDDYPYSGALEINGRGLERVTLIAMNRNIRLQVDFNGDSTGSGFGDIDVSLDTTWQDLMNRDFTQ